MQEDFPQKQELVLDHSLRRLVEDIIQVENQHEHISDEVAGQSFENFEPGDINERNEKEKIILDRIRKRNKRTLETIGLGIDLSDQNDIAITGEKVVSVPRMILDIESEKKFLNFLRSLRLKDFSVYQENLLTVIARKLILQVKIERKLRLSDSALESVINEYKRLGIYREVVEMDNFLSYSKQECLGEYALAIKRDLFTPIGGAHFNISTYQRSLSSKSYIEMWEEKVFETLAETKKNPKARELYNKILRYARRCIEYANNDQVLKDNESRGVDMERILYIKTTMQRVKERLNQLQEI